MAAELTALSEPLFDLLQKEKFVILNSIDAESGSPTVNAISWVYAVSPKKIRFAVDQRSRIVSNIKQSNQVALTFFGSGTVNAIYGTAYVATESLENVPFPLACLDIEINSIRDAMFYGARISVEPEYEKTYDKRAAEKLDGQVYSAMKNA